MLMVLAFLVLFFSLLSLAYSRLGALIRAEAARTRQLQTDEGSVTAVARGVALLESGYPPTNPYICGVAIDTSAGTRTFTVTIASPANGSWTVSAVPAAEGDNPQAMPLVFTSTTPP